MKKRNVMIQTAVASALLAMLGAANAGTLSTANTVFASQLFKSTNTTPVALTPGAVTYSTSSSLTANPSTNLYFVIRLTNATFATLPGVTDFKLAGVTAGATATSGAAGVAFAMSTDGSTLQATFTTQTTATTLLGLSAMTFTPATGAIKADNVALSVPGTTIGATAVLTLTNNSSLEATTALPTSMDLPAATGTVATSTSAIAGAVSALSTYTNKIDLTASPVASNYVTAGQMALGSVTFTTTAGRKDAGDVTDYTLERDSATTALSASIVVTPGAGQAFPVGAVLAYDKTSSACASTIGALAAVTAANATTAKTLTVAANEVTSGTAIYVCMSNPSTGNTAAPLTATLAATTVTTSADAPVTASGSGFPVTYNGSVATVRNYIPAAVTGFSQVVRLINTGSVGAAIYVSLIDDVTGVAGTAVQIGNAQVAAGANLLPGAAVRYSQADIEAVLTVPSTKRPRLRFTAATNGLEAQTLMLSNGVYTNLNGQDSN